MINSELLNLKNIPEELHQYCHMTINNEVFRPITTEEITVDNDDIEHINYTIIKTGEQVYNDWQAQQNVIPKPSQQDTLNAQLLKDNATMKVEMNNQKALNSQLLLEIAKLKQGGTANV